MTNERKNYSEKLSTSEQSELESLEKEGYKLEGFRPFGCTQVDVPMVSPPCRGSGNTQCSTCKFPLHKAMEWNGLCAYSK